MKRLFDVTVALVLLVFLTPLLVAIAMACLVSNRGHVLFSQDRVGRQGRIFRIWKFRTMRVSDAADTRQVTADDDARITRLGRVLRATKLDELPQLYNVLVGDMSLVGPRPEVPRYVAYWPPAARERILSVRPGITDPASIRYRHESAELALSPDPEHYYVHVILPRKVSMYLEYVQARSFLGDVRLLWLTAEALLRPSRDPLQVTFSRR